MKYASIFIGVPYLFGGNTPKGFDNSGFVQYVYEHFNIIVGRTVYDQINMGIEVSKEDLLPGDIIFFGSGKIPNSVAIYMGGNCYISAEHSGVGIELMSRDDYVTARRVIE